MKNNYPSTRSVIEVGQRSKPRHKYGGSSDTRTSSPALKRMATSNQDTLLRLCDDAVVLEWSDFGASQVLELFAYRQQFAYGRRPISVPTRVNLTNEIVRQKWDVWGDLADMPPSAALLRYAVTVERLCQIKLEPTEDEEYSRQMVLHPESVCSGGFLAAVGRLFGGDDNESQRTNETESSVTKKRRRRAPLEALRLEKAVLVAELTEVRSSSATEDHSFSQSDATDEGGLRSRPAPVLPLHPRERRQLRQMRQHRDQLTATASVSAEEEEGSEVVGTSVVSSERSEGGRQRSRSRSPHSRGRAVAGNSIISRGTDTTASSSSSSVGGRTPTSSSRARVRRRAPLPGTARLLLLLFAGGRLVQRLVRVRRRARERQRLSRAADLRRLKEFCSSMGGAGGGIPVTLYSATGAASDMLAFFSDDRTCVIVAPSLRPLVAARLAEKDGEAVVLDTSSLLDVRDRLTSLAFARAVAHRCDRGEAPPLHKNCVSVVSSAMTLNFEARDQYLHQRLYDGFKVLVMRRLHLMREEVEAARRRQREQQQRAAVTPRAAGSAPASSPPSSHADEDPDVNSVAVRREVKGGEPVPPGFVMAKARGDRVLVVRSSHPSVRVGSELLSINGVSAWTFSRPQLLALQQGRLFGAPHDRGMNCDVLLQLRATSELMFNRLEVALALERVPSGLGPVRMFGARLTLATALEELLLRGLPVLKVYPDRKAVSRKLWLVAPHSGDAELLLSRSKPRPAAAAATTTGGGAAAGPAASTSNSSSKGVPLSDVSAVLCGDAFRSLSQLGIDPVANEFISVVSSERLLVFQVEDSGVRLSLLTLLVNYCSLDVLRANESIVEGEQLALSSAAAHRGGGGGGSASIGSSIS